MDDFSQCGETEILRKIFSIIGTKNKKALEFGAGDGYTISNVRGLMDKEKWKCTMWDIKPRSEFVYQEKVTVENINKLCSAYSIPDDMDLISIDIDGNDYWVWKAMEIKPRVVIIEFNHNFIHGEKQTIIYDPDFIFDDTDYYGATYDAMKMLGEEKGYELIWNNLLNMIFVLKSELNNDLNVIKHFEDFRFDYHRGFPIDIKNRTWHKLT